MDEKAERPRSSEDLKLMYKDALDLIKQIEVASGRCTKLEDVFAPDLLALRYRFRELGEKLICSSPQQFGKVVREKLWRYAFYDVICRARRFVKGKVWEPLPKAFITQHLYHGVGYLNVMLMKLEGWQDFQESKFPFTPNGIDAILPNGFEMLKLEDEEKAKKAEPPKWLTDLLFFIHINIGDLYRYLTDILAKENDDESKDCLFRAMEYYLEAFVLYPDYGLAMNQIGNLSVKVNYGVDTTYYMLHSMLSVIPYEGAAPNLRNHLESCLVHYAKLPATYDAKPIEIFCNMLLKQVHNFLYENLSIPHFSKNFSDVIVQFQERLASVDSDLDEQLLFRVACISVYTFWQLQAQNSANISLAVAFATAMFSQILARVGAVLEKHSFVKQCVRKKSLPPLKEVIKDSEKDGYISEKGKDCEPELSEKFHALEVDKNAAGSSSDSEDDDNEPSRYDAVLRKNRRRKVFKNMLSGSSSEGSGSEDEQFGVQEDSETDQSDWTDSEEEYSESDCIGSSLKDEVQTKTNGRNPAFESSSPHSCSDSVNSDHIDMQEKTDSGKASESSSASAKESAEEKEIQVGQQMAIGIAELEKCRSELEPVLVALLPFIEWIQTSPGIKDAFAANCGKEYVNTLCSVFNLLLSEGWEDVMGELSDEVKQQWQTVRDETEYKGELFKWQLPEDRSLMGLPHLQEWIKGLEDGSSLQKNDLLITRMGRIVNFGQWMVSTKCFWIAYDGEPKAFKYQSPRATSNSTGTEKIKRLMDLDPASDALSRAYMAGKTSEPSRRNRRERSDRRRGGRRRRRDPADQVKDSGSIVYIIVDLPAVLYYLKNIQKLANKRRFVVVFPQPVWKAVDEMKEARGAEASLAIRASEWIRTSITRDHKGVRCLRDHENSTSGISVPKNLDKKGRQFFNMIESCNYLLTHDSYDDPSSRTFFGDMRDKFRVICLSGYEDILTDELLGFSPIAVARSAGTFVDLIEQYPPVSRRRKWRKSKSNG